MNSSEALPPDQMDVPGQAPVNILSISDRTKKLLKDAGLSSVADVEQELQGHTLQERVTGCGPK